MLVSVCDGTQLRGGKVLTQAAVSVRTESFLFVLDAVRDKSQPWVRDCTHACSLGLEDCSETEKWVWVISVLDWSVDSMQKWQNFSQRISNLVMLLVVQTWLHAVLPKCEDYITSLLFPISIVSCSTYVPMYATKNCCSLLGVGIARDRTGEGRMYCTEIQTSPTKIITQMHKSPLFKILDLYKCLKSSCLCQTK